MPVHKKKRAFEKARPVANTKLFNGKSRIRRVRVRGGNYKFRALRIKEGNFNWASEAIARKTRIINVVYNASNNELVRTNTLVKNCIVTIDASPFSGWYLNQYGVNLAGIFHITQERKPKKRLSRLQLKNQSEPKIESLRDKKIESLILKLLISSTK